MSLRFRYVISSFLFRLLCGGIVISYSWVFASSAPSGSYLYLAVSVLFSSAPALLVPSIIKFLEQRLKATQAIISGQVAIALITSSSMLWFDNVALNLLNYFLIWIAFYVVDIGFDMWLAEVKHHFEHQEISNLIGFSAALNQGAMLIGPILAALLTEHAGRNFYFLTAVATLIIASALNADRNKKKRHDSNTLAPSREKTATLLKKYPSLLLIPLMLNWPIAASINYLLPMSISQNEYWDFVNLGIADAVFGAGMVIFGAVYLRFRLSGSGRRCASTFLIMTGISSATWLTLTHNFSALCISMLIYGTAYAAVRVYTKDFLIQSYTSKEVGEITSQCNALGVFITAPVILFQYSFPTAAWLAPILALLTSLFCILKIRHHSQDTSIVQQSE